MLIKLDNPSVLSKAIEIISELVTEVRIKVNDFGMSIIAIDPANVAMVSFKFPKSAFSQFEVSSEKSDNPDGKLSAMQNEIEQKIAKPSSEILGVNLDDLKRILKRSNAKSSLILKKEENTLNIQIYDRIKRSFKLGLIDIESEDKEMPYLEYSSQVEMNSADFIDSIEDCSVVADSCSFIISDGKFIIEAKGLNSAHAEFSGDEAKILAEDCKSKYSLEYLSKIMKGAKISEKTVLHFSNDHPLKTEFRAEGIELSFILAPRVETED